jgi:hypothetical protein
LIRNDNPSLSFTVVSTPHSVLFARLGAWGETRCNAGNNT